MWIRSQDGKQLINVDAFYIRLTQKGYVICSANRLLGTYSTEEKTMNVMDMIEDTILKCECMRTGYAEYDFGEFVFHMPLDEDVEV